MSANDLKRPEDPKAARWLEDAAGDCANQRGSVASVVGRSFDAYARVFHPVIGPDGGLVEWSQVAQRTGRVVHPLMQWEALVSAGGDAVPEEGRWNGRKPSKGGLPGQTLAHLCRILAAYSAIPSRCYLAFWEGWEWLGIEPERDDGLRLNRPGRGYFVFEASLATIERDAEDREAAAIGSPNLLWPADRTWLVGSEIDFDSTLVGGTDELIDDIVRCAGLEAHRVEPGDSLRFDGDQVNQPN